MIYDFSNTLNRENTASVKYDLREKMFGCPNIVPMWVADMDFPTPDFIIKRIEQRLNHPILGYTFRDDEFNTSISNWLSKRHGWVIEKQWLSFCPGIVAGLNHAVQAFTKNRDKVLIQTPVYHPFFYAVQQNGRRLVENQLLNNGKRYAIDFKLLENQLRNGVKLFILCNPHNPVGRVWTHDELCKIAELCLKYNILVIADEIHADIVFSPHKHIPFASLSNEVSNITLTFGSASKTFNIAGLATAYAVVSNEMNLKQYNLQLERNGTNMGNVLGYEATKGAYTLQGEEWLMQLLDYLQGNIDFVRDFITQKLPKIKLMEPEGTYLLWLDFKAFGLNNDELTDMLINKVGVGFNTGEVFGSNGSGFQRMNIACPRSIIEKVLNNLTTVFSKF
jgi:cystathionine beta-lyase